MHITNLSNVLFFSEKNKVFKKKNKTFSLKEQELFKIWPVVFSIMASTCRNSLFFLQIFQLLRKHPARRHSGWKIYIAKCFSRKISFRKTIPWENQRNTDSAEGFQSPTEAHSRTQSFSRNAHEQGVCGKSEGFEGFFRVSFIEHDLWSYSTERSKISYFFYQ